MKAILEFNLDDFDEVFEEFYGILENKNINLDKILI